MQLPQTVEVLNRTYKVIEEDLTEAGLLGVSRHDKGVIKIEETLDNQEKANTFLHEMIHALLTAMGHELRGKEEVLHTENNVRILSNGLVTIFRDNPDTFKNIIDNLERDDLDDEDEYEYEYEYEE